MRRREKIGARGGTPESNNADISFAYINEIYPNRIYFEVTQPITAPAAYKMAHWTFGTISGNYWVGDCSFNNDTSAVLIDDNKDERIDNHLQVVCSKFTEIEMV